MAALALWSECLVEPGSHLPPRWRGEPRALSLQVTALKRCGDKKIALFMLARHNSFRIQLSCLFPPAAALPRR